MNNKALGNLKDALNIDDIPRPKILNPMRGRLFEVFDVEGPGSSIQTRLGLQKCHGWDVANMEVLRA